MKRDRTIDWPAESNRDSIARELDSIHFRFPIAKRKKLREALRKIFEWQWPPDKPPNEKPGHVLQPFDKNLLIPAGKEKCDPETLRQRIRDLADEGCIEVVTVNGDKDGYRLSIDWDNLFGVSSEWRAARLNPPVENENSTGGISVNWEKLASVEGIAALKASIDADEVSLQAKRRLLALLSEQAGASEDTQSGLSTTTRIDGRITDSEDVPQFVSSDSPPVENANSTGGKLNSTGGISSFMNHEFMKSNKTFMNHEFMRDLEVPPVENENSTGGVLTLPRKAKSRAGKRQTWWLDDPYYDVTEQHLRDPYHRVRMLEMIVRKGILHENEVSAAQWDGICDYALLADDKGSAFHGNVNRLIRNRGKSNKNTAAAPATASVQDLPASLDEASLDWCYALLPDRYTREEFLQLKKARPDHDPRKDPVMRGKLSSAYLKLRQKLKGGGEPDG